MRRVAPHRSKGRNPMRRDSALSLAPIAVGFCNCERKVDHVSRSVLLASLIAVLALALAAPAWPERPLTTLTFDELSTQSIDGLSFNGVTFAFEEGGAPSTDAFYGGLGPGSITWVQDPSLVGASSGTLTLVFDQPTTVLQFGIARNCVCTLAPGVAVDLFRPGVTESLSSTLTTTTSPLELDGFSEAQFSYSGPAIRKAVITFSSPETADRFALDSLTFRART
jgi:hypothetical protein